MPIYEYKCLSCGKQFEQLRSISDDSPLTCPDCGGKTKKLVTSAGLLFKGSGFYITDYASKNGSGSAASPKPSASSSEPKTPAPEKKNSGSAE